MHKCKWKHRKRGSQAAWIVRLQDFQRNVDFAFVRASHLYLQLLNDLHLDPALGRTAIIQGVFTVQVPEREREKCKHVMTYPDTQSTRSIRDPILTPRERSVSTFGPSATNCVTDLPDTVHTHILYGCVLAFWDCLAVYATVLTLHARASRPDDTNTLISKCKGHWCIRDQIAASNHDFT